MQLKRFASDAYGAGMHLGPVCESACRCSVPSHREQTVEQESGEKPRPAELRRGCPG